MIKIYLVLVRATTASAIVVFAPGVAEHFGHSLHWLSIFVGGHHVLEEIGQVIHPRKEIQHG